jgi:hypothetical protein
MKFARRNSLTFPLPYSSTAAKEPYLAFDDDQFDPFHELVVRRRTAGNPPFPLASKIGMTGEIEKAVMSDDSQSTSTTSHCTEVTDDDEIRISNHSEKASTISTPVPARKKALQIPAAKRKGMGLLDDSPTSGTEHTLDLSSLSLDSTVDSSQSKSRRIAPLDPPSREVSERSSRKSTSSRRSNRKPRKKVHFRQTCTVRRTISHKDMTPKEIRRTWLSSEEYNRMQLRDEIIADRVDEGNVKPGTCVRGLESKIEESAMRKLNLRMTGVEEVMTEQERQWDEAGDAIHFYYDFSAFQYVYSQVSEEALATAQKVARKDRFEAEKILASSSLSKAKGLAGVVKRSRFTRRRSWA